MRNNPNRLKRLAMAGVIAAFIGFGAQQVVAAPTSQEASSPTATTLVELTDASSPVTTVPYVDVTDINVTDINVTDINVTDINVTDIDVTDINPLLPCKLTAKLTHTKKGDYITGKICKGAAGESISILQAPQLVTVFEGATNNKGEFAFKFKADKNSTYIVYFYNYDDNFENSNVVLKP
jgi:hypothetical protein